MSGIKTGEEEVNDGRYEHGCCRAVRKPSPPNKFFVNSGLAKKQEACSKEKTYTRITTDAEKSTTNTPVIDLVDESHSTSSEEDARTMQENGN